MLEKKSNPTTDDKNDKDAASTNSKPSKNGEKCDTNNQSWTPISVDVVDIPIPSDLFNEMVSFDSFVPINDIPTPTNIPVPPENCRTTTPIPRSLTPVNIPVRQPPLPPALPVTNVPPPAIPATVTKKPAEPPKPAKPKVTKLPMPPGIKQTDLEAIESPPSRTPSPTPVPSAKPKTPPRKSGIMNLPMPPVVPGSEELSGDDDAANTPPRIVSNRVPDKFARPAPKPKLKRPKILKRRGSRSQNTMGVDWGERCVDVFEMITQIGEGTYGQVYKARDVQAGMLVALKKVRLENEKDGFPITAVREIKILRQLNHKNIVNLREVVTDKRDALDFRKVSFSLLIYFLSFF